MIRFDGHLHTRASHDSHASPLRVARWALRRGLGAIAVTDHDTMDGVDLVRRAIDRIGAGLTIVPGIEVTTDRRTHVLGYFLSRPPRSTALSDVVDEIHDLGGLVAIPHPFRRDTGLLANLAEGRHGAREVDAVLARVDLLELSNAKSGGGEMSRTLDVIDDLPPHPLIAGSDAHVPHEVGRSYVELPSADPDGLRRGGVVVRREYHPASSNTASPGAADRVRDARKRAFSVVPAEVKAPWRAVKRRVRERIADRRELALTDSLDVDRWERDPAGRVVVASDQAPASSSDDRRKVPA